MVYHLLGLNKIIQNTLNIKKYLPPESPPDFTLLDVFDPPVDPLLNIFEPPGDAPLLDVLDPPEFVLGP